MAIVVEGGENDDGTEYIVVEQSINQKSQAPPTLTLRKPIN